MSRVGLVLGLVLSLAVHAWVLWARPAPEAEADAALAMAVPAVVETPAEVGEPEPAPEPMPDEPTEPEDAALDEPLVEPAGVLPDVRAERAAADAGEPGAAEEPALEPTPVPDPVATPQPTPTPEPEPVPEPAPDPEPVAEPEPVLPPIGSVPSLSPAPERVEPGDAGAPDTHSNTDAVEAGSGAAEAAPPVVPARAGTRVGGDAPVTGRDVAGSEDGEYLPSLRVRWGRDALEVLASGQAVLVELDVETRRPVDVLERERGDWRRKPGPVDPSRFSYVLRGVAGDPTTAAWRDGLRAGDGRELAVLLHRRVVAQVRQSARVQAEVHDVVVEDVALLEGTLTLRGESLVWRTTGVALRE